MTKNKIDLTSLAEGTRFLTDRLGAVLTIATLGMLLAALAILLQIYVGLPDNILVELVLFAVCLLPFEMYFIPRFLMSIDAQIVGNALNASDEWEQRFKERWIRALGGKILLFTACILFGSLGLFVPLGVIAIVAFGWVPMRILLCGESIVQAARGSLEMMSRAWQKVFVVVIAVTVVYALAIIIINFVVEFFIKELTAQQLIAHPVAWISSFIVSAFKLWYSACFLSLYHKIERN